MSGRLWPRDISLNVDPRGETVTDADFVAQRAAELLATVRRAEAELNALEQIPLEDNWDEYAVLRVKGRRHNVDLTYVLMKVHHSAGVRWYHTGARRNEAYLAGWPAVQEWLSHWQRIDEIVELVPRTEPTNEPTNEPTATNLVGEKLI